MRKKCAAGWNFFEGGRFSVVYFSEMGYILAGGAVSERVLQTPPSYKWKILLLP